MTWMLNQVPILTHRTSYLFYHCLRRRHCPLQTKGGNGGTIYKTLEQGKTYDLDVGVAKEISHIEFCFSCQKVTRNSVQIADTKQPACPATATGTINHEAAQSAKEVSVKVDIVNDKSHFALTITDAPYADAGKSITIPAFCVDYSRGIYGSTFDMDIISAFDKESMSAYGSDANGQEKAPVDFPDQLPNLGWLMNEINVGDTFDDMKECQGTIDWNEYQVALWYVIDDVKSDTSKIHPYYNGGNFQECVALGLAQMALEKGNGWTPDCNNAGELVPLLFIVDSDNTVGGSGSIEKQVLMGQVELASIEGMCVCETEAPTEAPTTSAPTKAPTNAPVTSKSGPEDEKMTTASPPGTKGDPHFKTHGGEMYDFHGGCDLVLLDNPDFLDGLGMLIHIRTKIETWWSYVESAAIRIGDETLVVRGGNKDEWLLTNGEANAAVEEEKWYLSKFAGLTLRYKQSRAGREVHIYMPNGEKVMIKSFHDFVKVELKADGSEYFQGSHGLLGRFPDGKRVARDGETFIEDVNAFGQEWQVLVEEPKLFGNYDDKWVVPAGQKCAMPSETLEKKQLRQRRLASGIPMEDAEKACAHLADASDHKACVFDVIATQDTNMAAVW